MRQTGAVPHESVADHRAALARLLGAPATVRVALDQHALGLVLAADVTAGDDLPRFDSSAMDGFAVRPADADQRIFPVVADVPAGSPASHALRPGEAARVMTGARLPDGTVAVVPVERTDAAPTGPPPATVTIAVGVEPGRHVRPRGEDVTAGAVVARCGERVTAAVIALGRSAGCLSVAVHPAIRVAVVATGSELASGAPGPGGIHESNSEMVAALAAGAGCRVVRVTTCDDDPARFGALLDDLCADPEVDLVVTTGGVSAGAYEVVRQVCEPYSGFEFVHLAMQPGGPQGLGRHRDTAVVCLPGTPVGAFVAFHVLLRPVLDRRHGRPVVEASTATYAGPPRRVRPGRVQFLTSVRSPDGTVRAADGRHLSALAAATCLVEVPAEADTVTAGDVVTVHRIDA